MKAGDRDFFLEEELLTGGGAPRQDEGRSISNLPQPDVWHQFDDKSTTWTTGACTAVLAVSSDRASSLLAYVVSKTYL